MTVAQIPIAWPLAMVVAFIARLSSIPRAGFVVEANVLPEEKTWDDDATRYMEKATAETTDALRSKRSANVVSPFVWTWFLA